MDFLKDLFGDGAMTYEQLAEKVTANKMNIVDLSRGGYISQAKYNDRTNELNEQVNLLQGQITQRDTDLEALRTNFEAAKADAEKLPELQKSFTELQGKYETDKSNFAKQIEKQQRSFAIRERANGMKFTSTAAKKEFIREAESKGFKLENDNLLGYDEFMAKYKAENADSFIPDEKPEEKPNPSIVLPNTKPNSNNKNGFSFRFSGVRPYPDNE